MSFHVFLQILAQVDTGGWVFDIVNGRWILPRRVSVPSFRLVTSHRGSPGTARREEPGGVLSKPFTVGERETRFAEKCQSESRESLAQLPLVVNVTHCHGTLVTTKKWTLDATINYTPDFIRISPVFPQMPFL